MKRRLLSKSGLAHPCGGRSPRTLAALFGATLWLGALSYGCDESGPRVYTAQRYAAEDGCLEAYSAIGLVEAEKVSALCAPACLGFGEDLYVSTLCPPYPGEATPEPEDVEGCAAALAAPTCDELAEAPDAG